MNWLTDPRQTREQDIEYDYDETAVLALLDAMCKAFGVDDIFYRGIDEHEYEIEWVTSGGSRFYYSTSDLEAALVKEFGARP